MRPTDARPPATITALPADDRRSQPRRAPRRQARDLGERLALWLADVAAEAVSRGRTDDPETADPPDWPEAG